jgi:Secretion system C-terminal sorting domain
VQQGGFIILKINDQQYFKQYANPISGNAIGFQGCLKSAWEIDKIIVKQLERSKDHRANIISAAIDSVKQAHKNDVTTLKVFPNPFINEFTVLVAAEKTTTAKIELFDVLGNLIMQYDKKLDAGEQTVRLYADVSPGTYIIKATIDNKVTSTKIVKL